MPTERRIVALPERSGSKCEGSEFEEAMRLFHEGRADGSTGYDWWIKPYVVQVREVSEWRNTDEVPFPHGGIYYR